MQSVVSVRGQTVIPKEIRDRLGIRPQMKLKWEVANGHIHVIPIPEDPVRALIGVLKGQGTTEDLLAERRAERDKEEEDFQRFLDRWRSSS